MSAGKVARISYLNTDPFFHSWPPGPFEFLGGSPRALAEAAREGEVIAGPLPLVECWELENDFAPLGRWGIAAREMSQSVLLLSHRPLSTMDGATIGVTRESSTSVVLLEVLIRHRYGHQAKIKRGFDVSDDGWLLIGDQALQVGSKAKVPTWTTVTDLATEWWDWKRLPFVFAQWVVKKDLAPEVRRRLTASVREGLTAGLDALETIAAKRSAELRLPASAIVAYLKGFNYVLGTEEGESMRIFRALVNRMKRGLVVERR